MIHSMKCFGQERKIIIESNFENFCDKVDHTERQPAKAGGFCAGRRGLKVHPPTRSALQKHCDCNKSIQHLLKTNLEST